MGTGTGTDRERERVSENGLALSKLSHRIYEVRQILCFLFCSHSATHPSVKIPTIKPPINVTIFVRSSELPTKMRAQLTKAGPGQSPHNPHPTPKIAAPASRRASTLPAGLGGKGSPEGFTPFSRRRKKRNVTARAVENRSHRDGSHSSQMLKAFTTFSCTVMPPMPKPNANRTPTPNPTATCPACLSTNFRIAKQAAKISTPIAVVQKKTSNSPAVPPFRPEITGPVPFSHRALSCSKCDTIPTKKPKHTNVAVAARDLTEKRDKPQRPCPAVQPFPIEVPNPTQRPPPK
mmetsp:Transcript_28575/g.55967  ORF Transcript_28575/g.55967 Transcript_28575/m.55967 type:complete len:291 (-) Transcript_28575:453-1325(-)